MPVTTRKKIDLKIRNLAVMKYLPLGSNLHNFSHLESGDTYVPFGYKT